MSNGRYSVMVTATGSGYSRWNDLAVTRWQADPTEDRCGTLSSSCATSATGRMVVGDSRAEAGAGRDRADASSATTRRPSSRRSARCAREVECIVVSEGNGEGRRVTSSTTAPTDRIIEVTSFAELVLAPEAADNAHPAFSKMFVETEIAPSGNVILPSAASASTERAGHRRWRISSTDADRRRARREAETDRRAFIGRGRTIADAGRLRSRARGSSGSQGFTLDPVMALRRRVRVPASKKVSLTFWTVVGADRAEVEAAVGAARPSRELRSARRCWPGRARRCRPAISGLSLAEAANVQKLARYLIYPDPCLRAAAGGHRRRPRPAVGAVADEHLGRLPDLRRLRIGDVADLEIVAQALRFQEYMRARGLVADLVIVNEQAVVLRRRTCSRRSSSCAKTAACAAANSGRASTSSRCAAT